MHRLCRVKTSSSASKFTCFPGLDPSVPAASKLLSMSSSDSCSYADIGCMSCCVAIGKTFAFSWRGDGATVATTIVNGGHANLYIVEHLKQVKLVFLLYLRVKEDKAASGALP